ncbi:hypothetical protein QYF36_004914 [Acer negundo]|nr:hypothetical protein QYF36_004914 [Acer negundo]
MGQRGRWSGVVGQFQDRKGSGGRHQDSGAMAKRQPLMVADSDGKRILKSSNSLDSCNDYSNGFLGMKEVNDGGRDCGNNFKGGVIEDYDGKKKMELLLVNGPYLNSSDGLSLVGGTLVNITKAINFGDVESGDDEVIHG